MPISLANLSAQTFLDNVGSVNGGPEEKLMLGDAVDRRAYDEGMTLASLQELDAKRSMDHANQLKAEYEIQNQDQIRKFMDLERRTQMAEMEGNLTMLPKMQALKVAMFEAAQNKANYDNDLAISNLMFNKINRVKAHLESGNDGYANQEWASLVPQAEKLGIQLDPNKTWSKGDMPALTEMLTSFGGSADLYRELTLAQAKNPGKSPLEIANSYMDILLKQQELGFKTGKAGMEQVVTPFKKDLAAQFGLGYDRQGNLLRSTGNKSSPADPLTSGFMETISGALGGHFQNPTDANTAFRSMFQMVRGEDGAAIPMPVNLSEEEQAVFVDLLQKAQEGVPGAQEQLMAGTQAYIQAHLSGK